MQPNIGNRWMKWVLLAAAAVGLGAGMSALTRAEDLAPNFWMGWLGFTILFAVGFAVLIAAWKWAGRGRALAWMMAVAFGLRLGLGVALFEALPLQYQHENEQAGYFFIDPFVRDRNAWETARYHQPFWTAFRGDFNGDQYGGLAALSTLLYEGLSPDAHRPLLIVALGAMVAALGLPFFWRAARERWGDGVALPAAWIFALYPESILLGASQMREPFLLTFGAMTFWGVLDWLRPETISRGRPGAALAAGGGLLGLTIFSLPAAGAVLTFLGVWAAVERLARREKGSAPGWAVIGAATVGGLVLFPALLADRAAWEFAVTTKASGVVQGIVQRLGPAAQIPFITAYGVAQPVLPAAVADPSASWIRTAINILLGLGWYALAPLLVYATLRVWKEPDLRERQVLAWTALFAWVWILTSAYRAGGDQWDNPRYRTIFLPWMALLAGWAWNWARANRDAWLGRLLAVEGIFLASFTVWYANRKLGLGLPLGFWGAVGLTIGLSMLVLGWGWIREWRRAENQESRTEKEIADG
ncbi:MAG TPA: hypothetical protein VMT46_18465 [Anaerolineaceae bacterium]|nr:hypothetical protein [Anaerolineaceae bacterium]